MSGTRIHWALVTTDRPLTAWTSWTSRLGNGRSVRGVAPPMVIHVLFDGVPGPIGGDDRVIVEGAGLDDVVRAATRAAASADRIELCGGLPVDVAAAIREAVPAEVEVRVNRYGFESLEQAAAYKEAFRSGDPGDAAFFYSAAVTTPLVQHDGVLLAGVSGEADLATRVREALSRGAGIVELYAGLGVAAAAIAREASAHRLPVGFID